MSEQEPAQRLQFKYFPKWLCISDYEGKPFSKKGHFSIRSFQMFGTTCFVLPTKEQHPAPEQSPLTRSVQMTALLGALGLSVQETANVLGVTPNTTQTNRKRVFRKLDLEGPGAINGVPRRLAECGIIDFAGMVIPTFSIKPDTLNNLRQLSTGKTATDIERETTAQGQPCTERAIEVRIRQVCLAGNFVHRSIPLLTLLGIGADLIQLNQNVDPVAILPANAELLPAAAEHAPPVPQPSWPPQF